MYQGTSTYCIILFLVVSRLIVEGSGPAGIRAPKPRNRVQGSRVLLNPNPNAMGRPVLGCFGFVKVLGRFGQGGMLWMGGAYFKTRAPGCA